MDMTIRNTASISSKRNMRLNSINSIQELADVKILDAPPYSLTVQSDEVSQRKLEEPIGELMYFDFG